MPDTGCMREGRYRTAIDTEFEAGSLRGRGRITNVGEGGLFVGTRAIPEQGDTVQLSFRGPAGQVVDLSGLVWWTTQEPGNTHKVPGFGLRILDENQDYESFLRRFMG